MRPIAHPTVLERIVRQQLGDDIVEQIEAITDLAFRIDARLADLADQGLDPLIALLFEQGLPRRQSRGAGLERDVPPIPLAVDDAFDQPADLRVSRKFDLAQHLRGVGGIAMCPAQGFGGGRLARHHRQHLGHRQAARRPTLQPVQRPRRMIGVVGGDAVGRQEDGEPFGIGVGDGGAHAGVGVDAGDDERIDPGGAQAAGQAAILEAAVEAFDDHRLARFRRQGLRRLGAFAALHAQRLPGRAPVGHGVAGVGPHPRLHVEDRPTARSSVRKQARQRRHQHLGGRRQVVALEIVPLHIHQDEGGRHGIRSACRTGRRAGWR